MRAMATLAAALYVGLCPAAAQERPAGDDPAPAASPDRGSWLTRWLPFGRKDEKKPAEPPRPNVAESARSAREREEAAYHRRMEVCLKLREIADRTRDADLQRKVDQLEKIVWDTFTQRTRHLPASAATAGPDDEVLSQRLGPVGAGDRALSSPPARTAKTTGLAEKRE